MSDEKVCAVETENIPPVDEDIEEERHAKCHVAEPKGKVVEGKREKKVVQRFNMQMNKPKEKPKIESTGKGVKLGEIARINHCIGKLKAPLLKPLHNIVYDRPGAASSLRKNLRLFNGFTFDVDSDTYNKKLSKLTRLTKAQLKTICQTLDLERSGSGSVLAERIMTFLLYPTNSGKPVLKKKKKKTTKDVKGEKASSKSKKPQKKVEGGKSRAIVTDSSSDDDDDDDDNEEEKKESNETSTAVSQKRNNSDSQSSVKGEDDDDDDDDDDEEDEDAPEEDSEEEKKPKSPKKKSPAKKATKKPEDKSEELTTDDSDQCSKEDKIVKKMTKKPAAKRKASAKPIPKSKKADSSSNRGKKTLSKSKLDDSDSSDDDQPLIKMIKKPPTDDQLKATIQELLKDANLEEVTMKHLCRQVFDKYPDFDLTSRKNFIKDTVKSVLS